MILKKKSQSASKTKKIGRDFGQNILRLPRQKKAVIIGLTGELGFGKTCFLQGFAKGLRIKEKILSPTFVIFKRFDIRNKKFKSFYHFDCYRINDAKEMLSLGFEKIISDPDNIVAIEWPEKIAKILPKNIFKINFKFIDRHKREIVFHGKEINNH